MATRTRGRSGFTLAELLVVISILAILLTSLCGIYLAIISQWQRQQGQRDAMVAVSRTFAAVSSEVSQAVSVDIVTHGNPHGAIFYTLPLDKDTSNKYYVPTWVSGNLQYRLGAQKAFYLSDSTGHFDRNGNILWRGIVSGSYPFSYSVDPDPTWDADAQRGRISPIETLSFNVDDWGTPHRVTLTATTSYTAMASHFDVVRNISVSLRNTN